MNRMKKEFIRVLGVAFGLVLTCGPASGKDQIYGIGTSPGQHTPPPMAIEPFTFAAIPDTQVHAFSPAWFRGFVDHTSWIRAHAASNNIVFVTHLGDVVQGQLEGLENLPTLGWQDQLNRAHAAIAQLDAVNLDDGRALPYSISLGNHDLLPHGDKLNWGDPIPGGGFRAYFGAARYAPYRVDQDNPYQWYGGSDVTQWNHYQLIKAGPYTYLHLNLEFEPQDPTNDIGIPRVPGVDDALTWAQSVIDAHPGLPTIISSHKLITDLQGQNALTGYWGDGVDQFFGGRRTTTGQIVWERLVKGNPQVFMTINGHEHEGPYREDGEHHQVSVNDSGMSVFEILVNHQGYFNLLTGNDPYLRLIEFDPRKGQIRNMTFSPTFARYAADPNEIESAFVDMLDAFDAGMFVPILSGEDVLGVIAPFPLFPGDVPETRELAAAVILDFFAASDVDQLRQVQFSPYLTDADSQFAFDVGFDATGRPTLAQLVPMNVHPFHCSDTWYLQRKIPFIPVAVLGSEELAAEQINPASLRLEGVNAHDFHRLRDIGTPAGPVVASSSIQDCEVTQRDGVDDLLVFFSRAQVLAALGELADGQVLELRLTGNLNAEFGGAPIVGEDVVVIDLRMPGWVDARSVVRPLQKTEGVRHR